MPFLPASLLVDPVLVRFARPWPPFMEGETGAFERALANTLITNGSAVPAIGPQPPPAPPAAPVSQEDLDDMERNELERKAQSIGLNVETIHPSDRRRKTPSDDDIRLAIQARLDKAEADAKASTKL